MLLHAVLLRRNLRRVRTCTKRRHRTEGPFAFARYTARKVERTHTTAVIQGYLDELSMLRGDAPAEPVVRELLTRAAGRLQLLCATLLYRSYPRLARPPLNVQSEEMLSAVVERLLKAMRQTRPENVRQFFHIANQHMRWELNDLARRLDGQMPTVPMSELVPSPPLSTASQLSPVARRLLDAIEALPADEREVFELIRLQGLSQPEAAEVLGVAVKTVQRRLTRGLYTLAQSVGDLQEPGATRERLEP